MSNSPIISVIIPVYNTAKHLEKCLDSIVSQTYKNLEIILVDDGSTDNSAEICRKYSEIDKRVIFVSKENEGVSKTRNKGISLARGDYYHFPDSDDYLELDTYEYLLDLIKKHNCDAVAFEHFVTYPNREIAHSTEKSRYGLFDAVKTQKILMSGMQFCCNKLYSKKLIEGLSFREDIYRGEDTLFAAQALDKADSVWFDPRPLYHYVQSEESACRGLFRPSQFTVLKLYEAYQPLYGKKHPEVMPYFLLFMQEVLISLYYDVWSDKNARQYAKQKKEMYRSICSHYKFIAKSGLLSKKQKIKFYIFKCSPTLFCALHKLIHKL